MKPGVGTYPSPGFSILIVLKIRLVLIGPLKHSILIIVKHMVSPCSSALVTEMNILLELWLLLKQTTTCTVMSLINKQLP